MVMVSIDATRLARNTIHLRAGRKLARDLHTIRERAFREYYTYSNSRALRYMYIAWRAHAPGVNLVCGREDRRSVYVCGFCLYTILATAPILYVSGMMLPKTVGPIVMVRRVCVFGWYVCFGWIRGRDVRLRSAIHGRKELYNDRRIHTHVMFLCARSKGRVCVCVFVM